MRFQPKKIIRQILLTSSILILLIFASTIHRPESHCIDLRKNRTFTFKGDVINHLKISYPINKENACASRNVRIIMPVHSAVTNFARRNLTRFSRHGLYAKDSVNGALLLFFVGLPSNKLGANVSDFQQQLVKEAEKFGDIIQINITDTYKNLVQKAMGVLNWISTYCSKSEFVLKIDDDIQINPHPLVVTLFQRRMECPNFVIGELRTERKPLRSLTSKWHMPVEEFPHSTYPPFVPGPAVGYPTATALLLYQQALRTKFIWLDDVFITGICTQILGIPLVDDIQFATESLHTNYQRPLHFIYQ